MSWLLGMPCRRLLGEMGVCTRDGYAIDRKEKSRVEENYVAGYPFVRLRAHGRKQSPTSSYTVFLLYKH